MIKGILRGFSFDVDGSLIIGTRYFPSTLFKVKGNDECNNILEMEHPIGSQLTTRKFFYTTSLLYNESCELENKVLLPYNFYDHNIKNIGGACPLYTFDLTTKKFDETSFIFPNDIGLDSYTSVPLLVKGNNEFVLSFISSNKVFRFNNLDHYSTTEVKSKYENSDFKNFDKIKNPLMKYAREFRFYSIMYDKYRKQYYRFWPLLAAFGRF